MLDAAALRQWCAAGLEALNAARAEIDDLNDLAWSLRQDETDRAYSLSQEALLRSSSDDVEAPYLLGQATSLTTLG